MGKFFVHIILLLSFICSCTSTSKNERQVQSVNNKTAIKSKELTFDAVYNEYISDSLKRKELNLKDFKVYQTFDEYQMRPKGKPHKKPFVYYRKIADTIFVITSDNQAKVHIYIKKGSEWHSREHSNLWRVDQEVDKNYNGKWAMAYYRICGNDSIIECGYNFWKDLPPIKSLYIKTKAFCWVIGLKEDIHMTDARYIFRDLRQLANQVSYKKTATETYIWLNGKKCWYAEFKLIKNKNSYAYKRKGKKDSLVFTKNSLVFGNIQPGIENYDREKSLISRDL